MIRPITGHAYVPYAGSTAVGVPSPATNAPCGAVAIAATTKVMMR
jgi:hypothetical protein